MNLSLFVISCGNDRSLAFIFSFLFFKYFDQSQFNLIEKEAREMGGERRLPSNFLIVVSFDFEIFRCF